MKDALLIRASLAILDLKMIISRCLLCGCQADYGPRCCHDCWQVLPWISDGYCHICARSLAKGQSVCGQCQKKPPAFQRCLPLLKYDPLLQTLIQRFKYHRQWLYGALLADMMHFALSPYLPILLEASWVPVPLHFTRQCKRGFNQTQWLLQAVAKRYPLLIESAWVKRQKRTAYQSLLPFANRKQNVTNAFVLKKIEPAYKRVVIFDDVMTTGNTVNAVAKLLQPYAKDIWVVCLCRAGEAWAN